MTSRRGRKKKKNSTHGQEYAIIDALEVEDTTCKDCFAEFVDLEDLHDHIIQVHAFRENVCRFCPTYHTSVEDLAKHIIRKHIVNLKCCDLCFRVFPDENSFINHKEKHIVKENFFSCALCRMLFSSSVELSKHDSTMHAAELDGLILKGLLPHLSAHLKCEARTFLQNIQEKKPLKCICSFKTLDVDMYLNHLNKCTSNTHTCNLCGFTVKYKRSLVKHFLRKRGCFRTNLKPTTTSKCKTCNRKVLVQHNKNHKKNCSVMKCLKCSKVFYKLEDLTSHQVVDHPTAMTIHKCEYCRQELLGMKLFKKHVEWAHGHHYQTYKYNCAYCPDIFNHPQKLFTHICSRHKDISQFHCNICDSHFKMRKRFTLHIKLVHESKGYVEFDEKLAVYFNENKSDKPYQPPPKQKLFSDEYEKEFQQLGLTDVAAPRKKVTKEKKSCTNNKESYGKIWIDQVYNDTECTEIEVLQSSDDESPLQIPTKKVSKKKLPFNCRMCKRSFYFELNFNKHMRLHYGGDAKQCPKCGKFFKDLETMKQHMKDNHTACTDNITEHLKKLIEKRNKDTLSNPIKTFNFQRTIKKVLYTQTDVPAKIKEVANMSAKNFLETFTDESEVRILKNPDFDPETRVTIKPTFEMKPAGGIIKSIVKCDMSQPVYDGKLALPVRYSKPYHQTSDDAAIIQISQENKPKPALNFGNTTFHEEPDYCDDEYIVPDYHATGPDNSIPEFEREEEIVNENNTEEQKKTDDEIFKTPNTIYIPRLTKQHGVKVATFMAKAPFYKIVPLEDIDKEDSDENQEEPIKEMNIQGAKLVKANPLEHLIKEPEAEVFKPKRKYYRPKIRNPQQALMSALLVLQNKQPVRTKPKKGIRYINTKKTHEGHLDKNSKETYEEEYLDETTGEIKGSKVVENNTNAGTTEHDLQIQ